MIYGWLRTLQTPSPPEGMLEFAGFHTPSRALEDICKNTHLCCCLAAMYFNIDVDTGSNPTDISDMQQMQPKEPCVVV